MLLLLMLATSLTLSAQGPGQGPGSRQQQGPSDRQACQGGGDRIEILLRGIPDITPEQETSIRELHLKLMGAIVPMQAHARELQAHLESLSVAEVPDMKAINTTIDQISQTRADIAKLRMKFRMDVRALLTPEQRVVFDSKACRMGQHMGPGEGPGGRGPGNNPPSCPKR